MPGPGRGANGDAFHLLKLGGFAMVVICLLGCKTDPVPTSQKLKEPTPGKQSRSENGIPAGILIPGMSHVAPNIDTFPFSPEEDCIQAHLGPPRWKTIRSGGMDIRVAHGADFGLRGREQSNEYYRIYEVKCKTLRGARMSPLTNLVAPAPRCSDGRPAPIHAARKGSRFFLHFGEAYFKTVRVNADGRGIHLLLGGLDSCSLAEQKVLSVVEGDCNVETFVVLESRATSRVWGRSVDGKMEFDIFLRGDTVMPATESGKWPCKFDVSP